MYMQARNGMGEIDWGGIIKDVTGGYVAVKTAQAAAKTAQAQALAPQFPTYPNLTYGQSPQLSPYYGTPAAQPSNIMPIVLIGGVALLAFMLLRN